MKNIKELWRMSAHITAVAVVVLTGFISSGCGTKTVVVLLPEINGSAGEVIVTAQKSSEVLDQPYESAHVKASGQVVKKNRTFGSKQVQKTFGEALAIQPLPPMVFMLYFKSGGTELTEASSFLIFKILKNISRRQSSYISVVGHTDRVGDADKNWQLSMDRAKHVANLLIATGLNPSLIEISSHGENNPVIPTDDDVPEPKNRRVETVVR